MTLIVQVPAIRSVQALRDASAGKPWIPHDTTMTSALPDVEFVGDVNLVTEMRKDATSMEQLELWNCESC